MRWRAEALLMFLPVTHNSIVSLLPGERPCRRFSLPVLDHCYPASTDFEVLRAKNNQYDLRSTPHDCDLDVSQAFKRCFWLPVVKLSY